MRACEGRRAPTGGKGDRGHPALLARPDSRGPVATQGPPASEVLLAPTGVPGAKASRAKLVTLAGMAGLGWTLSGRKANADPSVCVLPACTHVHASLRIWSLSCALLCAEVEQVPCTPEPKDMLMISCCRTRGIPWPARQSWEARRTRSRRTRRAARCARCSWREGCTRKAGACWLHGSRGAERQAWRPRSRRCRRACG